MPSQEPAFYVTANCVKCLNCHALQGTVFRFECSVEAKHFVRVVVTKAGTCSGEVRDRKAKSSRFDGEEASAVTTEDHRRILDGQFDNGSAMANTHCCPCANGRACRQCRTRESNALMEEASVWELHRRASRI